MGERQSQTDQFKEAARALECDDDPERFRERVGKRVKQRVGGEAE